MPISRRRLLEALGIGAAVGTAGCGAADRVRSLASDGSAPPEGDLDTPLRDAVYAPGRCVDVDHRMLTVRDVASLREHDGNDVATGLIDYPTGKAEQAFGLDPATVERYAEYGTAELFAGTFDREAVLESYRGDGWTVAETYHGVDVVVHPDQPEQHAAGVGDGVFFTSARHRATAPDEFVRAHAEALAGETERYGDGGEMGELLSVIGGGDYVSAITSPADLGDRPPHTLALGRSLEQTGSGLTDTMAFLFDSSAPKSPATYIEEWSDRWSDGVDPNLWSDMESGTSDRVGYFSVNRPERAFVGEQRVVGMVRDSGPTVAMQEHIDERYTAEHGLEPPEARFSYRRLDDGAEVDCGDGSVPVAVTHESGESVLARRLGVGNVQAGDVHSFDECGYGFDGTVTAGETVRIGFEYPPVGPFTAYWTGPHGNAQVLPTTEQG